MPVGKGGLIVDPCLRLDHFNSSCIVEVMSLRTKVNSMNKETATKVFESLASGIRLDVWRLLVKAGLDGRVAGELASELDVAPNTLSFHLKAMLNAGLLSVAQEGRFLRYRANIPLMLDLIGYLTEECCAGHPEACGMMRAESACSPHVLPTQPCCNKE